MKLSFVNDIAALCENLGAASADVLYGVGLDNRIGNKFLTPGPGWGGSCFPKDVRALANIADKEQIMMPLLTASIESNENAQNRVVKQVNSYFNSESRNITISIWGLSFKANTDDIRNSPAINIARKIISLGYKVICYDPAVPYVSGISVVDNIIESTENSDLIIVLTEWAEFSTIDPTSLVKQVKQKNVLDARGVLNKEKWTNSGFSFI
jgi:UDPglucose 6-dehydrogenase